MTFIPKGPAIPIIMNAIAKAEVSTDEQDEWLEELVELGGLDGYFCTDLIEPIPKFRDAECETIYRGKNNSYIVLGRDRHSNLASGAGGAGYMQSGMIDLVTGRAALNSADEMKKGNAPVGKEEKINPNFITDAARVYITQKSLNIDKYFGYKNTTTPASLINEKSAVALKADHARIIGRQTVRIYCGQTENGEGLGNDGETNSTGGKMTPPKIELVSGNGMEKNLQPAVLGNNLIDYLHKVEGEISKCRSSIGKIFEQLIALNSAVAVLTLGAPPYSTNLAKDIEKWVEQLFGNINSEIRRLDALNGLELLKGASSVVSSHVFVS